MELDKKDRLIIHMLNENSNATLKEMREVLDLQVSTIHNRINKLQEGGYLKGSSAIVNYNALGYKIVAFIMLTFDKDNTELDQEHVAGQFANIPRVEEVHLMAGEFDILLKVRAKDIDDLGIFVTKKLKEYQGAGRSRTLISLSKVKEHYHAPFLTEELLDTD